MSACPCCGVTARHVATVIPWDSAAKVMVQHRCETAWCVQGTFLEPAQDVEAVIRRAIAYRGGYDHAGNPHTQENAGGRR